MPRDGASDSLKPDVTSTGGATGGMAGAGGMVGAGGMAGLGGASGCGGGVLVTTTVSGLGFDAWDGGSVQICLRQSQVPYRDACAGGTVTNGGFAVTDSLCSAVFWSATVFQGAGGHSINCNGAGIGGDVMLTPANCTCLTATGVDNQHTAVSGCVDVADGGADADASPDAARDTVNDAPSGS
jgi:hypothetical protein